MENLNIEELKEKLKTAEGSERAKVMNRLALGLMYSNPEEAIEWNQQAMALAKELNDEKEMGVSYNLIAMINSIKGNSKIAISYFQEALKYYRLANYQTGEYHANNNVGVVYYNLGLYEQALTYFFRNLKISEEGGMDDEYVTHCTNISTVYASLEQYDKSLEYAQRALEMSLKLNDPPKIMMGYNAIANIYGKQKKYDLSNEAHQKVVEIGIENITLTNSYHNLGSNLFSSEKYEEAHEFFSKALTLNQKIGYQRGIASNLNMLGMIHYKEGEYEKALEYIRDAIKIGKEVNAQEALLRYYLDCCEVYEAMGNFEQAYLYQKKYAKLNNEISGKQVQEKAVEMEIRYETEKKEREAEIYRLKNVELVEKNELISKQKEEIAVALDELKRTQKNLVEAEKMVSLSGLVAGVAHEINTPVGVAITASSTLIRKTNEITEKYNEDDLDTDDFEKYLEKVNQTNTLILKSMQRTSELVDSFKQVSVDQSTEHPRQFNLKTYLQDVVLSLESDFKDRAIQINVDCDDDLIINSYPGAFAQIFTHLLMNSLIHGFVDTDTGTIDIQVINDNENLLITYRDDGLGIDKNDLSKIFDPFFTRNKNIGKGLGLHIVYNLITQKLRGSITCESQKGEGVVFELKLIPF